ncbi:HAD-IA family hydrolase [Kaistia sp. MMO-174]|uniref:HAD-IA family hydrolase n=1 Tax=Kaistia sp. MMO-174 TaxID=3081256 RepID=UPI00301697F7
MSGVLLFDLDGTLLDIDHLHYEAWRQQVARLGVALDPQRYRTQVMGFPNETILADLVPALSREEGAALVEAKEVLFRSLATDLVPAEGLLDFLGWVDNTGARYGVVTNAPRPNAEQELAGIGLAERFATVVIGDELAHAKQHPLPYLVGLERLGGSAAHSVAFEDSISGIRAAVAAGLAVVGLTTGLPAERLLQEGAGLAIPHFDDPRLRPFVAACLEGVPA